MEEEWSRQRNNNPQRIMSQESLVKFWVFPESKRACICPPLFSAISLRSHFLKSKNISLYHHIKMFKNKQTNKPKKKKKKALIVVS